MENINMVKYNYFYLIFICLLVLTTHAQKVSNITFKQEQSNIVVSYDLETKTPCKVSLYVSTNGGTSWQGPLKKVTGNVGDKVVSDKNSILWNVLEEFEELRGSEIMFKITAQDDYEIVKIENISWMVKNLNVSTYRNGDIIPEVNDENEWSKLKTGAWCYYKNDSNNGTIYGKLYNWHAVNDSRGLAPEGFHIAKDSELNLLELKKSNEFNALAGGYRNGNGEFDLIGINGFWWSSTESIPFSALYHYLNFENKVNGRYQANIKEGFSVRCIKD